MITASNSTSKESRKRENNENFLRFIMNGDTYNTIKSDPQPTKKAIELFFQASGIMIDQSTARYRLKNFRKVFDEDGNQYIINTKSVIKC